MEIRLLGLMRATHDGHDLLLGGPKPRALLSMLALDANAPVSVDRLIDGLWGEHPPATAPKLVQVLVSQLRKQLPGAEAEIVTRGRGYELRVDPDAVDALRFERLLQAEASAEQLQEALALWRGPPLDDLADEPFAAPEIRRLEDLWLQAREAAIDIALAEGRHTAVAGELDDLVRAHPLRERLRAQQMLALYRCGRQADALEAFRQARAFLLDEVGLEPGPELRHLNDAILRQEPALDSPPARRLLGPNRARPSPRRLVAAAVVLLAGAGALAFAESRGSSGPGRIAENTAGLIDPATGRIVKQYPVGHAADAFASGAGSVWSANGRDGTVSRIDRANGSVNTIPVGGEPTALAFGGGSLWVTDGEASRVDQVNFATNRVIRTLRVGNAPRGVAVTSGAVWVSSAVDGQVQRLDLTRSGRARAIDVAGGPTAIAADAGAVWVASEENGIVTKLDARTGAPVKPIRVGNAPSALAVGFGGIWVANRDDGTVTRIDAITDVVNATVPVHGSPVAIVAGVGAIWVADADGAVIRIDPATRTVSRRIPTGSAPSALALEGRDLWVGTTASPATHRGGTLHYEIGPEPGAFPCICVDPAEHNGDAGPVLSLAYDGLVGYRRVSGVGGSTLVADLADSVPQPENGGRTYTFQLRRGLRFSDGNPVRPTDFRASIQREVRLASPFFGGIAGAAACTARRCDLSAGIETDDAARTITIHLRRPDAEFLYKLATASVLPANVPATLLQRRAAPGTGPYAITSIVPKRELRLTRNPYFHSWSSEARPDGFPDVITAGMSADAAAQVSAVHTDHADAVVFAGGYSGLGQLAVARAIAFADASRVHAGPAVTNSYIFLNVGERPFDDPRVRQALNFAIDRHRVLALAGGSSLNALSCQILPPGVAGYTPTCPYTRDATAGGGWTGPDLAHARRLVAASGTRGQRVEVLSPTKYAPIMRYAGRVLEQLGYRVRVRVMPPDPYYRYIYDPHHHTQVMFYNWYGDFPTAPTFFESLSCARLTRDAATNENPAHFCDRGLDAGVRHALVAHGADANARWAALDRKLVAAAPAVPLFSRRMLLLVSDRVGNAQLHQTLGPLLDQFWVR